LQKLLTQPNSDIVSIADIEEKYFNMERLSDEEHRALRNFERYRVKKLRKSQDQRRFDKNFTRMQVLSNLANYTEFLKPRYDF